MFLLMTPGNCTGLCAPPGSDSFSSTYRVNLIRDLIKALPPDVSHSASQGTSIPALQKTEDAAAVLPLFHLTR